MSVCYRCHRDDVYGSRLRGTKGPRQELKWVCPDCSEHEGPVTIERWHPGPAFWGTITGCAVALTGLLEILVHTL